MARVCRERSWLSVSTALVTSSIDGHVLDQFSDYLTSLHEPLSPSYVTPARKISNSIPHTHTHT